MKAWMVFANGVPLVDTEYDYLVYEREEWARSFCVGDAGGDEVIPVHILTEDEYEQLQVRPRTGPCGIIWQRI